MNQAIVDCLKNGRKNVGMTQKQVAEKIGVRQSVYSQWETGRYEPDIDTLLELLRIYNLDYKEVFPNIQKAENEHRFFLSDAEEEIILSIRSLPDTMRNTIVDLIREIVKISDKKSDEDDDEYSAAYPYISIPYGYARPSAGQGNELYDGMSKINIKNTKFSAKADYVVQVSGNSMKPHFDDRDLVLVKSQDDVNDGEFGIWSVDGQVYIKQKKQNTLHSTNPDYPDVQLNENSSVFCLGKVLGKAEI